ncbi:hypothetical protein [Parendozoicomonas sp. Alg238-R29]|uniref:hypothetical protein n=1 Tax=Parendozoicomonas sp. Alg238-R29 TaxID=2993446 RepID=UPI00248DE175|nr:hypothetical protein [Parendozoicomonas sp. Alg238-R29]
MLNRCGCYGGAVIYAKIANIFVCLASMVVVGLSTPVFAMFGKFDLPSLRSLVSFDETIAVWISGDSKRLCMQRNWEVKPHCKLISSFFREEDGTPLDEDFFLSEDGYELTGALSVHHYKKMTWIYIGSKEHLFQLKFEETFDQAEKCWLPKYQYALENVLTSKPRAHINHIKAYDQKYKLSNTSPTNQPWEFNLIVSYKGIGEVKDRIVFYDFRDQFETTQVTEMIYEETLGTQSPFRGIEMTPRGLYIATSTSLYFFRQTESGLDLGLVASASLKEFLEFNQYTKNDIDIRSITYSPSPVRKHEGYLTVSTDAGIFISDLHTNTWRDGKMQVGGDGSNTCNPSSYFARVEHRAGGSCIYYRADDNYFDKHDWRDGVAEVGIMPTSFTPLGSVWPSLNPNEWERGTTSDIDDEIVGPMDGIGHAHSPAQIPVQTTQSITTSRHLNLVSTKPIVNPKRSKSETLSHPSSYVWNIHRGNYSVSHSWPNSDSFPGTTKSKQESVQPLLFLPSNSGSADQLPPPFMEAHGSGGK